MAENKTADSQFILGANAKLNLDGGSMIQVEPTTAELPVVEPGHAAGYPTEEEKKTLRRVAGKLPTVVYSLCAVEFAERASYYGCSMIFSNFVNRPLPAGGNGYGAPPRGTQQTAGALGMGTVKATAVSQSFSMLAYALPVVFGWLSDTKTGRFKLICAGIGVVGVAHVLMVASGSRDLLASGNAKAPFLLSVYILSVGSAMFKPNISPTLLDQMPHKELYVETTKSGERVIVDPEHTTERAMLWFYLLINIGAFMAVPTSYCEKYIGWWLAFLLPLLLYLPLPILLWWLKDKLILYPPGGSDLGNIIRILGICFKRGGIFRIGRGFFEPAKPSNIAKSQNPIQVPWNDAFVDDVRRTFQATGIFLFVPIQNINDNGLGNAASALSTMLTTNGVPNDVINNFNSLIIIAMAPVLNYGLYPLLRKYNIRFGPISRMTTGFMISVLGGIGYTVLNYYAYKLGPCGHYGSSSSCVDADGVSLVSNISIWWMAIPYALGGFSELFVNVPAYGIAYSMAPKNMRGLVSALFLFNQAIAYAVGLACAGLVKDPYITWDLGAPAIIGFVSACIFYYIYRDVDNMEYTLTKNGDYHNNLPASEKTVSDDGRPEIGGTEKHELGSPEVTEKYELNGSSEDKVHEKDGKTTERVEIGI